MPREYYVYPNGNQIPIAGSCEYATQLPMSAGDSTDVYTAISSKADNVSLPAAQSGTDLTLVTTGDKYNWDNNDASSKVSKSGDTMTGPLTLSGTQVQRAGGNTTWIKGRDVAPVKTTSGGSSWNPVVSAKSVNGAWGIGTLNDVLYFSYGTDTNYNNNTNTTNNYSIDSSGNFSGKAANVTGTVAIANGGTGATTAANARTNLAVPYMYTDSYPTLQQPGGGNSWIKIGTSNTSYGLLPSASGGAGSGHNYIGTSSWYWKYAYIDQIYGFLNGSINGNAAYATSSGTCTTATYGKLTSAGTTTNYTAKSFTIPAAAYEIVIACVYTSVSKLFCTSVPKAVLTANNLQLWVSGGRGNTLGSMNGDSARCLCNVKISGTTFTLQGVSCTNEGTPNEACTWYVYYR